MVTRGLSLARLCLVAAASVCHGLQNIAESGRVVLTGTTPTHVAFDFVNKDSGEDDANIPVVVAFPAGLGDSQIKASGDYSVFVDDVTQEGFSISLAFDVAVSEEAAAATEVTEVYWIAATEGVWRLNDHILLQASVEDFEEHLYDTDNMINLNVDGAILENAAQDSAESPRVFGSVLGALTATDKDGDGTTLEKKFNSVNFHTRGRDQVKARVELAELDIVEKNYTLQGRLGYIVVGLKNGYEDDTFDWTLPFDTSSNMLRDARIPTKGALFGSRGNVRYHFDYAHWGGALSAPPHVFAQIQSQFDIDPAHVAGLVSYKENFTCWVVEDTTKDDETVHKGVTLSLLALVSSSPATERICIPAMSCHNICPDDKPICTETDGHPGYECTEASTAPAPAEASTAPAPAEASTAPAPAASSAPEVQPTVIPAVTPGTKKSHVAVVVGLVVATLGIIGAVVGGIFYWRHRRNRSIIQNYMMSLNSDDELLFSGEDNADTDDSTLLQ